MTTKFGTDIHKNKWNIKYQLSFKHQNNKNDESDISQNHSRSYEMLAKNEVPL